ncbi:hypothetical protein GCM10008090_11540 [Arenicella chitinivorans]|uniref:Uncharacterized protein n=2 Tax=Arenicella chitinivorans TaxID=1329800 RepID=A0A918RLU2_9GAMM|nr:hypothetical protein GCM10008090_11540 [Arenicella chitinivorans]
MGILALLLQLLTSGLPEDQRPSVLAALQNTNLSLALSYLCLGLIALVVRARRYQLLLEMSGEESVPNLRQMALVTGVRNMIVDMFPSRLGELGYVGLLNRGYGVKIQHCVSSLSITIAFDFIAVLMVILLILLKQLIVGEVQGWALGALITAAVLSVVAIMGLFVITPWVNSYLQRIQPRKSDSLLAKVLQLANDLTVSLQTVRRAGRSATVLGLSLLIRLLKYAGMYLLFVAVAGPSFSMLAQLPAEQVIGALIGGEIGASMPIPTFMSFGAYEAGSTLVFQLLGVADQAAAFVTMLSVHIWSQVMDYLLGGLFLAIFVWVVRGRGAAGDQRPERGGWLAGLKLVLAGFVLLTSSGFLAYQLWAASKLGALAPPAAGVESQTASSERQQALASLQGLRGFVLFSSNRDGNHDIFRLNLADFSLSKVTEHPHTETYPRVSPDGTRMVFARAHQIWVSQRNTLAWDVMLLDLETGEERQLAKAATAPNWINTNEVSYLLDGQNVVRHNISTGQTSTVLVPGLNNRLPTSAKLQNPHVDAQSGEVSFTGRQNEIGSPHGHWGTALTRQGAIQPVLEGCELRWWQDGSGLYQVAKGGRDNDLRIVSLSPDTLEPTTLIDLAGEFSHEYWPFESNDGRYIVFGASRGKAAHEHDVADYEIFLWRRGSDADTATRLTFHSGNDNWPSVYIQE